MFLLHFKAHEIFVYLMCIFVIPKQGPHLGEHCANTQPDTGKLCAEFYAVTEFYAITYSPVSLTELLVG